MECNVLHTVETKKMRGGGQNQGWVHEVTDEVIQSNVGYDTTRNASKVIHARQGADGRGRRGQGRTGQVRVRQGRTGQDMTRQN